jgi:hypothetical protein
VTLNLTLATRKIIYQMGDFRVTDTTTGEYKDHIAQKQVQIQRFRWSALVSFAGVGSVGNLGVSDWLAGQTRKIPGDATVEALISLLLEADQWLRRVPPRHRRHTFTIAAFVGSKPLTALVSNFESIDGRQESSARTRFMLLAIDHPSRALSLPGKGQHQ